MKLHALFRSVPFLALAAVATGCGTAVSSSNTAVTSRPSPVSAEEFEALYRARLESARGRYTEADVRFMTRMLAHHAQAIEMARLAPERTANSAVETLAARIVNAQNDEIATIRQWLTDRGQSVPQIDAGDPLTGHAAHDVHDADMPGMIPPDQIRQLEASRGRDFDLLFLSLMIRHHGGAVTMVEELFRTDGAGQDEAVFKFASDVQVDQRTEIARMESMLSSMAGAPVGR